MLRKTYFAYIHIFYYSINFLHIFLLRGMASHYSVHRGKPFCSSSIELLQKNPSQVHYQRALLTTHRLNQLKQDMGFSQIRFYCFQRTIGRVFHIMTINDSMANEVVKFFYNFQLYASSLSFFLAPSR